MISSGANAQIKYVSQLLKKRSARKKEGVFVMEGLRMFAEVPEDRLVAVYVTEDFANEHKALLENKRYELVSDTVFRTLSDTLTPQGVLAVVKQQEWTLEHILKGELAAGKFKIDGKSQMENRVPLILVLENLQDPGNLGTIVRTAEAAGVTGIILSKDCVDIYNPKVIRSTMGAIFRQPFAYVEDVIQTVGRLRDEGIAVYGASLADSEDYANLDYRKPTAFLIGNEGNGLTNEILSTADKSIHIPMCGKVESLNAAIAASVVMFEANRQRRI